ncbi:tRNA threonylcarbamoyladenosine dehydratase [Oribacterium sp. WCC10]|uniref:tRNA threonylcarbamoyladenosine dehydratase n=1 Tax=Oribacterium sp. WCC10 TaxID=1855343 RepID=UPI0008EC1AFA|nr:tRNA threonylcarbamoyladenosine dehydratase [Oribacterium sp. WCC10]SFG33882.1 tRNA A37 threonylcarbamoyladenosine dehydratase [Oribacterium sp. WCC10]
MLDQFSRTKLLLGVEAMEILQHSRVIVFGVGGVGGYVAEVLARSGVGSIDLVDNDTVSVTNINRQLIATTKTVGKYKVDVMADRIHEINPECNVSVHKTFYLPENSDSFDFKQYDYVVDAIDTITAKIQLIVACNEAGTPVMSSMGAGNKLDPTKFQVADIYRTSVDPLARVMRRELKKRNIKHLKVVYSTEESTRPIQEPQEAKILDEIKIVEKKTDRRKDVPGSVAFVPSVAGIIIGGEVIKDLTKNM